MPTRILVIDDEPGWLNFARDDLGTAFEVEVATDLETALAKLKKDLYDLIIAGSGRLNVLEAITKQFPRRRLVVATGQPTTGEAITMYRLGALDYFAKDFRRQVVSDKIHEAIQKSDRVHA